MGNLLTFAEEYRQKDFTQFPFCLIDSLILSQAAYFDYSSGPFVQPVFDKRLCDFFRQDQEILLKGLLTTNEDAKMLEILKLGGRHGNLRACNYVEEFCEECEKQFAAITFELGNGEYYIAFRGTDCSVVGWKEDFALSFQEQIPAQKAALRYVRRMMRRLPGLFYIGGHSKGGNLAVYAAMSLPAYLQRRLKAVYNFDGPGFLKQVYEKPGYHNIRHIVHKIVPHSSIIGMLLEEDDGYKVVTSTADAVRQHDPYSWVVCGSDFEYRETVDALSTIVKRVLDGWLQEISLEERRKIIDTVFDVIYDTGIVEFYEIAEQKFEKLKALLNQTANVDPEEKKRVFSAVKRLLTIAAEELHRSAREESVVQLEKRAWQLEQLLQSIQRGDWNKFK